MTVFILNHLYVFATVSALILIAIIAYGVGVQNGSAWNHRTKSWPLGPPRIRLDWVETTPVAIIESSPETAADVAAWLDAVKEGAVLRV